MASCNTGVISPTSQLNAQFVAVERLAPFARILKGMISGGYSHGIGPNISFSLRGNTPGISKESVENDNKQNHHLRGNADIQVNEIRDH